MKQFILISSLIIFNLSFMGCSDWLSGEDPEDVNVTAQTEPVDKNETNTTAPIDTNETNTFDPVEPDDINTTAPIDTNETNTSEPIDENISIPDNADLTNDADPKITILGENLFYNQYTVGFQVSNLNLSNIICSVNWNNEANTSYEFCGTQTLTHLFQTTGEKNITITASDTQNSSELSYLININEKADAIEVIKDMKVNILPNKVIQVVGSINRENTDIENIIIDFGVGGTVRTFDLNNSGVDFENFEEIFSYQSEGNYTLTITLRNENDIKISESYDLEVSDNYAPFIDVSNVRVASDRVTFDYEIYDPEGDAFTVFFDFDTDEVKTIQSTTKLSDTITYKFSNEYEEENATIKITTQDIFDSREYIFYADLNLSIRAENSEPIFTDLAVTRELIEINSTTSKNKVLLQGSLDFAYTDIISAVIDWGTNIEEITDFENIYSPKFFSTDILRTDFSITIKDELGVSCTKDYTVWLDNDAPEISAVNLVAFTNSNTEDITFQVTDNTEVTHYYISTINSEPTASSSLWIETNETTIETEFSFEDEDMNQTVYIWVKDRGDNIIGTSQNFIYDYIVAGSSDYYTIATGSNMDNTSNRKGFVSALVNNRIYVFGGYYIGTDGNTQVYHPEVNIFNIDSKTWSVGSNMITPRGYATASVVNNKIYIFGGINGNYNFLNNVEEYDPSTDTFSEVASMPTARWTATSSVFNDKIYVFGGYDEFQESNITEIYDPLSDTWGTGEDMPTARHSLTSSSFNGSIYLFGGYPNSNNLEIYDPLSNTWTTGANMPTAREDLKSAVLNNRIYVIGGNDGGTTNIPTIEIYNPSADSWTTGNSLLSAYYNLYVNQLNNQIFVLGSAGQMQILSFTAFTVDATNNQITISAEDNYRLGSYYFGIESNPYYYDYITFPNNPQSTTLTVDFNFSEYTTGTTFYGIIKDYLDNKYTEIYTLE